MKRRLIIARSLINTPRLIVLDEPTTGLDPQARYLVWQKLRQLKAQGSTMILTTHYMEEAHRLGDRLVVMDGGKILTEGSPSTLVERHVGKEVLELHAENGYFDALKWEVEQWDAEIEVADEIIFVFGKNGPLPQPVTPLQREVRRPAALEDVFLRLAGRVLQE
jgi:lipooligosaccharide transport system ATP-binding protein